MNLEAPKIWLFDPKNLILSWSLPKEENKISSLHIKLLMEYYYITSSSFSL